MTAGTSTIETATGGHKGSTRWMAPELVNSEDPDENFHTESSDIWALGMVYLVSIRSLILEKSILFNLIQRRC